MRSNESTSIATLARLNVDRQVFTRGHYSQVGRRVIQRVSINVVNVLGRLECSAHKLLHHDSVLRLVMSFFRQDVSIAVLQVRACEYLRPNWGTIAPHQGVMVLAQMFCDRFSLTPIHRALWPLPVVLSCLERVAMFIPALVVQPAKRPCRQIASFAAVDAAFPIHEVIVSEMGKYGKH